MNEHEMASAIEDRPWMIACKAIIGFGSINIQTRHDERGAPLLEREIAARGEALSSHYPRFETLKSVYNDRKAVVNRVVQARTKWQDRLNDSSRKAIFEALQNGVDENAPLTSQAICHEKLVADNAKVATRKSSKLTHENICPSTEVTAANLAGLTVSNLKKTSQIEPVSRGSFESVIFIAAWEKTHWRQASMGLLVMANSGTTEGSSRFLLIICTA